MTIITQGNSSTGTLNYLDSVTVEAGSGFASFESPSGTVVAQFSGARTFGPYSNRTYRVVSILGDIKYSINDDFPQGSVVQSVPVMGPSGTITGLRNPDGTVTDLGGSVANDLTASATIAPSKDAVNAALALKASILNSADLGTGAVALSLSNANRHLYATPAADTTMTVDTTTGTPDKGTAWEVYNASASKNLLWPVSIALPPSMTRTIGPKSTGYAELTVDGLVSLTPTSAPVTIAAGSGTAEGNTLTATRATGWIGAGNWQAAGADISGQTADTYVMAAGPGTVYRFRLGDYASNAITSLSGSASLTETLTTGGNAVNLDTLGSTDWQYFRNGSFPWVRADAPSGTPLAVIPASTFVNNGTETGDDAGQSVSWTNGSQGSATNRIDTRQIYPTDSTQPIKRIWTGIPGSTLQNSIYIGYESRRYEFGTTATKIGLKVTVHANDGSFTDLVQEVSGTVADYGYKKGEFRINYKLAGTSTITVTVESTPDMVAANSANAFIAPQYLALAENT